MHLFKSLLLCLTFVLIGFSGQAFESFPKSSAKLIKEYQEINSEKDNTLGLLIRIDKNWHTYWKNPGDSGASPIFQVHFEPELENQIEISEIIYPRPQRLESPPLTSFAYEDEVLLSFKVKLKDKIKTLKTDFIKIKLDAEWLVCKVECIPAFGSFETILKISEERSPSPYFDIFKQYQKKTPSPKNWLQASFKDENQSIKISIEPTKETSTKKIVDFFPLSNQGLKLQKAQIEDNESFYVEKARTQAPSQIEGLLIFENEKGEKSSSYIRATLQKSSVLKFIIFAFLGGLILNLMPCVFPIIAIKLLGLIKHGQNHPVTIRLHSLAYIGGVIISFLAFALLLVGLKASGQALGWGFQLQSPFFLSLLVFLFFILSLNFLGIYEFNFSGPTGIQKLLQKEGSLGQFLTGILSVIVASPCTAPFMGASLGFALSQSITIILIIFFFLALGFAFPYLLFLINPKITRFLPKPGNWMVKFREFLFFPMILTMIWLLWILGKIKGLDLVIDLLVSLTLVAAGFYFFKLKKFYWKIIALFLLLTAIFIPFKNWDSYQKGSLTQVKDNSANAIEWENFTKQNLDQKLSEKKALFLDFTAAWCVTCQVNEKLTFTNDKVKDFIKKHQITMMKADWTHRNPEITEILEKYGRIGVPFYLFWPAGQEKPHILPEVLTAQIFLKQLDVYFD